MPWWLSNPSAGLDIGSDSIKWSAVEPNKLRSYLLSAPLVEQRTSLSQDLDEKAREQRLSSVLQEFRHESPVWPKRIAASLQGPAISCGYREFPSLSSAELGVALRASVTGHVPYPESEQILSHEVVPPLLDSSCTGVFYTVTLREPATWLQGMLRRCGLEPAHLEVVPLSLTREFVRNHNVDREADGDAPFIGLVHCGFRYTQVVIHRRGFNYYARDFGIAGGEFTRAYQVSLGCDWTTAEASKKDSDLEKAAPPAVEWAVRRWSERVRIHIGNFCHKNHVHIDKVYLSGGSAAWNGLTERLQQHLQVPVVRDHWERMRAPKDFAGESIFYKAALGLALAGA